MKTKHGRRPVVAKKLQTQKGFLLHILHISRTNSGEDEQNCDRLV